MTVDLRKDKIFRLCDNVGSGGTPDSSNPDYYDGAIRWVQTGDLNDGLLSQTEKTITNQGLESSSAKVYPAGTLLIAMYGATIGKMSILEFSAATNQACCAMNFRSIMDTKYMFYKFLDIREPLIAQGYGGGQQNISQEIIKQTYIFFPRIEEQSLIAAYLDKTCATIDTAIEKKQKQLETLDALRKTIIHKAVTRGLNNSVELKDSGVEWSKLKPINWQTCRVKDIMDFFNTIRVPLSADIRGAMTDRIYEYYGASGVIDKVEDYLFDGTYLLIAEDGANILARNSPLAFLATGKFWVNNHAHILKPRFGNIRYFVYLLESLDYSLYVTGAAQPKLTKENLGKYKIIAPPIAEQDVITDYLDAKTRELKELIQNIVNQITALEQYRKSLIHECVTGKRRIAETHLEEIEAHV